MRCSWRWRRGARRGGTPARPAAPPASAAAACSRTGTLLHSPAPPPITTIKRYNIKRLGDCPAHIGSKQQHERCCQSHTSACTMRAERSVEAPKHHRGSRTSRHGDAAHLAGSSSARPAALPAERPWPPRFDRTFHRCGRPWPTPDWGTADSSALHALLCWSDLLASRHAFQQIPHALKHIPSSIVVTAAILGAAAIILSKARFELAKLPYLRLFLHYPCSTMFGHGCFQYGRVCTLRC